MRRLITIPLLLLVLATYGQAQEDNSEKNSSNVSKNDFEWKTHKFFFRLGFSTARGDYSSTEPRDDAGFADVGRNIEFGYEVRINENFGIMMRYSNMRHGIEEGEYANEINNQLIAATNMTDFSSRASFDNYRFNNFLVSPRLYNRIGKNSYFLITPTIGFSSMVIGQLQVTSFNDQFTIVAVQEETNAEQAFMYGIAGGFSFRTSKFISINLFAEYLEAEFDNIFASATATATVASLGASNRTSSTAIYDQKVQMLNFGIEIGYNF